jgi:hypothetical protein
MNHNLNNGYVLLEEKEEMWAQMLMDVLQDNQIPCTSLPVYGAGFAARTGMQERLKVFVPAQHLPQATELLQALFSAEVIFEES